MNPMLRQKKSSTREVTISVNITSSQNKRSTVESTISVDPNKQQIERVATSSYSNETASTSVSSNKGGRGNTMRASEGKVVMTRRLNTKDSRNKDLAICLNLLPKRTNEGYDLGDQGYLQVDRNNGMAAEEEQDDLTATAYYLTTFEKLENQLVLSLLN